MGADIWSIGNNHTMDAGVEGIISTRKIAADMGCKAFGAGLNEIEASEPVYLEEAGGIIRGANGSALAFDRTTPVIAANTRENYEKLNGIVQRHIPAFPYEEVFR